MCFQDYKCSALYKMAFALVTQNSNSEALLVWNRYHMDKYTGELIVGLNNIFDPVIEYILYIFFFLMKQHMNSIGMCVCMSVADCKAYLYATAASVVSRAPVAWVVSPCSAWENQRFSAQDGSSLPVSPLFTTLWMELQCRTMQQCFAWKRKETDCLKLESISKTSLFTGLTNQQIRLK